MIEMDHVAVQTPDIAAGVRWYVEQFGAEVLHEDSTWAFLRIGHGKLALVTPGQHPPHVALRVARAELEAAAARGHHEIATHRDGTAGIYIEDPAGNAIEIICYPVESGAQDAPE